MICHPPGSAVDIRDFDDDGRSVEIAWVDAPRVAGRQTSRQLTRSRSPESRGRPRSRGAIRGP